MKLTFLNLLFFLWLFSSCSSSVEKAVPEILELGKGWAKTSVNATVFRKNSVVSDDRFQFASWYDSLGFVIVARRLVGTTDWEKRKTRMKGNVNDAHNIISIILDGEGFLHLAWDHHNGPLKYCGSIEPGGMEFTEVQPMVGELEDNHVTYPEFYKMPDGDLLFAYRYGGSGRGNMVLNRYSVSDQRWRRVSDNLIDGEGERNAYWQMCVDSHGTIHLSWVWRETWDVFTNHDLCYARSLDGGKSWQSSSGEQLNVPINADNAEYAIHIAQGSSLINQTSITADQNGQPFITSYWTPQGEEVPQFFVVFLQNGKWDISRVTDRTLPFSLNGEGSRRIPISRPQVLVAEKQNKVHVLFRDKEQNNRICIASAKMNDLPMKWNLRTIPEVEVGQWEPSYDTEMWKKEEKLHLFVQQVGQGEGNENPEELAPTMVRILAFEDL